MSDTHPPTEDQAPSSEMVEWVACALERFAAREESNPGDNENYWYDLARAAIATMREPTQAMKLAVWGDARNPGELINSPIADLLLDSWRTMIDAALGKTP